MEQAQVAATLRWFVARSGAVHVVAATPAGTFGCDASGHVTVQRTDDDEPVAVAARPGAAPAALDVEPLRADPEDELEASAAAALALSRALGTAIPVVVWLADADGTELAISARDGEGVVIVLGEEQIEMEAGWPPPRPAPGAP